MRLRDGQAGLSGPISIKLAVVFLPQMSVCDCSPDWCSKELAVLLVFGPSTHTVEQGGFAGSSDHACTSVLRFPTFPPHQPPKSPSIAAEIHD